MDQIWAGKIPVLFEQTLRENGFDLGDRSRALFVAYAAQLIDWNRKINLISRTDIENLWTNHFVHSLSILFLLDIPIGSRILDVGTGGGLPGIPIAIVRPDLKITLLDSINKKTNALTAIVSDLGISNAKVINGRAEEVGKRRGYSSEFDIVIARAVAPLDDLIKWSLPFFDRRRAELAVQHSGEPNTAKVDMKTPALVALKGGDVESEIRRSLVKWSGIEIASMPLIFPGSDKFEYVEKKLIIAHPNRI